MLEIDFDNSLQSDSETIAGAVAKPNEPVVSARLNLNSAADWRRALTAVGYFVDDELAEKIARWWNASEPGIFEGGPGTGKTKLALKIAEVVGVEPYRLQCYDGITAEVALYFFHKRLQELEIERAMRGDKGLPENLAELVFSEKCMVKGKLAQALDDPNDDIIVIVDELDKNKSGALEAALLQYFDEQGTITVNETNRTLRLPKNKRLHTIITSNAGLDASGVKSGGKATLSYPVLRRCKYFYFAEPTVQRQAEILKDNVTSLSMSLCLEVALFVYKMNKLREMEKPISLGETINWARSLANRNAVTLLGQNHLIESTCDDLAKSERDINRFKGNVSQVLTGVQNTMIELRQRQKQ